MINVCQLAIPNKNKLRPSITQRWNKLNALARPRNNLSPTHNIRTAGSNENQNIASVKSIIGKETSNLERSEYSEYCQEETKKAASVIRTEAANSGGWDRTNDLVINSHPLFR